MNVSMMISNLQEDNIILQPWSYACRVADELFSLGCNVTVYTDNRLGEPSTPISIGKTVLEVLPISNLRFLDKRCLEIVRRNNPEVVYWFGNSLSGSYLTRLKSLGVAIVLHLSAWHHSLSDMLPLSMREKASHWLHLVTSIPPGSLLVRRLNDESITTLIVPSKAAKDRLSDFGVSKGKIEVSPLAFELNDAVLENPTSISNAREKLGLEKEAFIATYLGSPDTIRGTDTLVRAAFLLKSKMNNLKIIILSRRNPKKANKFEELLLERVKRYELGNLVDIVPGMLSRESIRNYILASDAIVLPFKITLSEPPLAILEAMAMGKVVVATNTGGLPEILGLDRGLLVQPGNAKHLASALNYLSRNPRIAHELEQNAKNFASNLPNWEDLGRWTKEVLHRAAARYSHLLENVCQ